ncbi:hypothetical protein LTR53_000188 [Teratosphaeriaceae sp. CCFEE 6253]|nr:hypothetical protein LTR53_000188 [Teratosphaeriaceae sp. CCFEE 6253]
MRFTSYKDSLELLATVLVVSTYEMIDGAGRVLDPAQPRYQRRVRRLGTGYLVGVVETGYGMLLLPLPSGIALMAVSCYDTWQRRNTNSYCMQWAAFREHRRCFSFFKPTKSYEAMDPWDLASKVVYILAQCVNYSSDEEKQQGEHDLGARILRANTLLDALSEWKSSLGVHFEPLPVEGPPSDRAFKPIWIHPSAFGVSLQMHSMARILLLIHQPTAGGYLEYLGRDKAITECIDTIGGIALRLDDDASRLMSTQCLFAAGLYCTDQGKRECIAELIAEHSAHTGWPANVILADELRVQWAKQKSG